MSVFVLNIEKTVGTTVVGVFINEKLAKEAARDYVSEKSYKKKQIKNEDIRKVLYVEDIKENPEIITMTSISFDFSKKKTKKDPNAPKKGLSAYFIFAQDNRTKIKEANPDTSFGEIGKIIGQEWRKLTDKQKEIYSVKAENDKKRYEQETEELTQVTTQVIEPESIPEPIKDEKPKRKVKAKVEVV